MTTKITPKQVEKILTDIDRDKGGMFICHMSRTFEELWDNPLMRDVIRSFAKEFLSRSHFGKAHVSKTNSYNECLFYERKYVVDVVSNRREVRRAFIAWLLNRTKADYKYFTDKTGKVWRRNGKTKFWKRNSERFQIPVKSGLYEYGYINEQNINNYNLS